MGLKNVGYLYDTVLLISAHPCCNIDAPLKHYVTGKSQLQKTTYCTILFVWNFENKQINRNRKVGWLMEKWGVTENGMRRLGVDGCTTLNILITGKCDFNKALIKMTSRL